MGAGGSKRFDMVERLTRSASSVVGKDSPDMPLTGGLAMKPTPISVAWVFAVSFYAAAAIGFIPNPLLGPHGLFVATPLTTSST